MSPWRHCNEKLKQEGVTAIKFVADQRRFMDWRLRRGQSQAIAANEAWLPP
jgi:hypothetical protein